MAHASEEILRAWHIEMRGVGERVEGSALGLSVEFVGGNARTRTSLCRRAARVDALPVASDTSNKTSSTAMAAENSNQECSGRARSIAWWHKQSHLHERGLILGEDALPRANDWALIGVVPAPEVETVAIEDRADGGGMPSICARRWDAINVEALGDEGGRDPDEALIDYAAENFALVRMKCPTV